MNAEKILQLVPDYEVFLTVDELAAECRRLSKEYPEVITLKSIGKSRKGDELWALVMGRGDKNALCFACPHPNEPIGAMTLIALAGIFAKDADLLEETGMTWHLIPCIDPDGTRLNEGWFRGPFNIENYVRGFYRPGGSQQVEWTFPMDYKGHTFSEPIPETRALMAMIRELKPSFVFSLHNSAFGGAYWYITNDDAGLCEKLENCAVRQGIPLHLGEPESFYIKKKSGAVHSMMSKKSYFDALEKEGRPVPPGPMSFGTCSADYLSTVCDSLVLIAELPYFLAEGVDDDSPSDMRRGAAFDEKAERRRAVYSFLKEHWGNVRDLMDSENPFPHLVDEAIELHCGEGEKRSDAAEYERLATRAEKLDCLTLARILEAQDLSLALRACNYALDKNPGLAEQAVLENARSEINERLHEECVTLEQGCAYEVITIKRAVSLQLESALQAVSRC